MIQRLLILALAVIATPAAAIVGGGGAPSEAIARAIVTVIGSRGTFCIGSVIAQDLVLTAAHCVLPGADYKVILPGETPPRLLDVRRSASHPQFNVASILAHCASADVALLQLASPLPQSKAPAPLGMPTIPIEVGSRLTVVTSASPLGYRLLLKQRVDEQSDIDCKRALDRHDKGLEFLEIPEHRAHGLGEDRSRDHQRKDRREAEEQKRKSAGDLFRFVVHRITVLDHETDNRSGVAAEHRHDDSEQGRKLRRVETVHEKQDNDQQQDSHMRSDQEHSGAILQLSFGHCYLMVLT
jgi:hypothetical protein